VASVAADLGVGWGTVMAAVRDYGTPLVENPPGFEHVDTIAVDETAFLAATPLSGTRFATGIVALKLSRLPRPLNQSGKQSGRPGFMSGLRSPR
jgi:hypothetical protein